MKQSNNKTIEQLNLIKLTFTLTTGAAILSLFAFFGWLIKDEAQLVRQPQVYQEEPAPEDLIVKIKGPLHRKIVFCKDKQGKQHICQRSQTIHIEPGSEKSLDLTGHPLEFGDIIANDVSGGYQQNGIVNVLDYSFIKGCRDLNATKGDANYDGGCKYADGNLDTNVNNFDVQLIQITLTEETDDE